MKIRKAVQSDLLALTALFEKYRTFYEMSPDPDTAFKFLKQRIANGDSEIFLAADEDTDPVGFVQLYPLFSSTRMKRLWLLNDLFVDPAFRGQRISIALIQKAKELCYETGAAGLILETAKSNHIGNGLYPKAGFVLDGEHHYYSWTLPAHAPHHN